MPPLKCGGQYLASKVRVVLTSPGHDITKTDYDPAFNEAILMFSEMRQPKSYLTKSKWAK